MPEASERSSTAFFWGFLLILATAVGNALGTLYVFHDLHDNYEMKEKSKVEESKTSAKPKLPEVTALGRIEPKDGVLYLGVAAPDRIRKICKQPGDPVKIGERLVELESETLRRLEVESSRIEWEAANKRLEAIKKSGAAQIKVEELRLRQVKDFSPLEIKAQESKIEFLTHQQTNAKLYYDHLEKTGDSISRQRIDRQRLLWQQAQEELAAAQMQLDKMNAGHPLDRELAEARLGSAKAELQRGQSTISLEQLTNQTKQAEARSQAAQIVAPCNGTILRILAHEGDLVQGKPVVQMANLDQMIVVAEVDISFKPYIHPKSRATITSPVFKEELSGEVYSIAAIVGKPQVTDPNPLAAVDYRIVEVRILLDKDKSEPAADYIGHEVTVHIDKSQERDNNQR